MWITTNCGKFLKKQEYQTTLPVSWETYICTKKEQWELDLEQWTGSNSGKEYNKVVYCHLFYFYAEHILENIRLDESQARIKISKRNINNLRYADDTTFMAESEKN